MITPYITSLIRTGVPLAIGAVLTWLASSLHIVVDPSSQAGLVALCAAVLSAAYYALVRLVERHVPAAGVLLGVPNPPVYATTLSTPVQGVRGETLPRDIAATYAATPTRVQTALAVKAPAKAANKPKAKRPATKAKAPKV